MALPPLVLRALALRVMFAGKYGPTGRRTTILLIKRICLKTSALPTSCWFRELGAIFANLLELQALTMNRNMSRL